MSRTARSSADASSAAGTGSAHDVHTDARRVDRRAVGARARRDARAPEARALREFLRASRRAVARCRAPADLTVARLRGVAGAADRRGLLAGHAAQGADVPEQRSSARCRERGHRRQPAGARAGSARRAARRSGPAVAGDGRGRPRGPRGSDARGHSLEPAAPRVRHGGQAVADGSAARRGARRAARLQGRAGPSEASALRWQDVGERTLLVQCATEEDGTIKATKVRKSRSVRLLPALAADLRA